MSVKGHMTKAERERVLKNEGREALCANLYNDYKCWKNTRCCEYLKDNTKCPVFVRIPEQEAG